MAAVKHDQDKAPVVQGFMQYFPLAIAAVAMTSKMGAEKYELEYSDRNFMELDPDRLLDADGRHTLAEAVDGMYDPESGLLHAAHHAWEAMARLEVLLTTGTPLREPEPVDEEVVVIEISGVAPPACPPRNPPAPVPVALPEFYQDDDGALFSPQRMCKGDRVLVPNPYYFSKRSKAVIIGHDENLILVELDEDDIPFYPRGSVLRLATPAIHRVKS